MASFSDDTSNESKNLVKSAEPLDKTKQRHIVFVDIGLAAE